MVLQAKGSSRSKLGSVSGCAQVTGESLYVRKEFVGGCLGSTYGGVACNCVGDVLVTKARLAGVKAAVDEDQAKIVTRVL